MKKRPKKYTEEEQLQRRKEDRAAIMRADFATSEKKEMDVQNMDFAEAESRVLASQNPTEGDLQLIQSPKHPGDIFVKVRGTKNTFICKFYGGNSGVSVAQAIINVHHFLECWNSYDKLSTENEQLKECLHEIEAVSCGKEQVAEDDSEGMGWVYKRIQALHKEIERRKK